MIWFVTRFSYHTRARARAKRTVMPYSKHLPQIIIPNYSLRRPRSNNHIIPQQAQPKPSLTVLEIIQPLPSKRLDLDVRCFRVRRAIFALDRILPVTQEVVAPNEEGFAVMRADVQHRGHFEGTTGAAMQGVQEDVDGGEIAAWEDVAVDEVWEVGFVIVELVACRIRCTLRKQETKRKGREGPTLLVMVIPSITILPSTGCNKLEITPKYPSRNCGPTCSNMPMEIIRS